MKIGGDGETLPSISARNIVEKEKGIFLAEGYVDLRYGGIRLQADHVLFDQARNHVEATGDVVLEQEGGTLSASRMEMSLESGKGTLWEVTGFQPPEYHFRAERMERIDETHYKIYDAVFTTCTQPTPYWSFRFKKGHIHLNKYAHLLNVRLKASKVPVFYSPYVVWPIKGDRATGFLLPEIGNSGTRGTVVSTAFFWAMMRNMDTTFYYDRYSDAGSGLGLEFRWLPNENGSVDLTAYELTRDADEDRSERYKVAMQAKQRFQSGWKLLSQYTMVSDSDYYNDFERDFDQSVNVDEFSFLNASRTWSYYTLNLRAEHREQFFEDDGSGDDTDNVIQRRLPEVELRTRSQQLGKSPLFLSFTASANGLERRETDLDADYQRLDVGATLSASFTPASWLDVTPVLNLRETYYTQQLDPDAEDGVSDDSLNRAFWSFSLNVLGPKFFRVFEPAQDSGGSRFKHTIEPTVTYGYLPEVDDVEDVILFDEIDRAPSKLNQVSYGVVQRLLRRQAMPQLVPEGEEAGPPEYGSAEEIASLEIRQTHSFDRDLSTSATLEESSSRGPITLLARYNPTRSVSADFRMDYDILHNEPRTISLSGTARSERLGSARLSYYVNRGLEEGTDDSGTVRLGGGSFLFARRLSFDVDFAYDLGADELQSQRYRLGYDTQCCGFISEYLERDYVGLVNPAREFRFSVTLKGVGTLFDLNSRIQ
jgi:lipopolysaccharide assembly outer membrane protein LptD (OstA)